MEGLITKPTALAAIGQAWSWGPGGAFTPWVPLAIPTNALTAPSTPGLPACHYVVRQPLWAMQGKKLRAPESEHPPSHSGPDGFSAQQGLSSCRLLTLAILPGFEGWGVHLSQNALEVC